MLPVDNCENSFSFPSFSPLLHHQSQKKEKGQGKKLDQASVVSLC